MKQAKYKLSICIPTYNRRDKVLELVRFLKIEFSKYSCCITVRDNASCDGTYDALRENFCDNSHIYIEKNFENIGLGGNLHLLYTDDKGEYLWVVGDDDWIGPGIGELIFNALSESSSGCYFINYRAVDRLGKVEFENAFSEDVAKNESLLPVFMMNGSVMMFITSMIYDVKEIKRLVDTKSSLYYPRLTLPLYVALSVSELGGVSYVRGDDYLVNTHGEISWRSDAWKVFLYQVPMELLRVFILSGNTTALKAFLHYYVKKVKEKIYRRLN